MQKINNDNNGKPKNKLTTFVESTFLYDQLSMYENITDVWWMENRLWLSNTTSRFEIVIPDNQKEDIIEEFGRMMNLICSHVGLNLNAFTPTVDATIDFGKESSWRVVLTASDANVSGKSSMVVRIAYNEKIPWFKSQKVHKILENCIKEKHNIFIFGVTGCGKTKLQKPLMNMIGDQELFSIIEDTPEIHPEWLFPNKFYENLTVGHDPKLLGQYIDSAFRKNPSFICVTELRQEGVGQFLRAMQSGHAGITTFHAENPELAINQLALLLSQSENIDVAVALKLMSAIANIGVWLKSDIDKKGQTHRWIEQIVEYSTDDNGVLKIKPIYTNEEHEPTYI